MLMFWYSKQEICIKWGNETSTCFIISNGVRQGGILAPTLFSIYMDDLSIILSKSGIGCHIDDLCINYVFYIYELCLIAPCAIALQELIGLCYEYCVDIDLYLYLSAKCMINVYLTVLFIYLYSIHN